MKATLDIRGQKLRTQTQRRFVVVAVRPRPVYVVEAGNRKRVFLDNTPNYRMATENRAVADATRDRLRAEGDADAKTLTYVAFADIVKRTDSYDTARTAQRRAANSHGIGVSVVIADTTTGEEI